MCGEEEESKRIPHPIYSNYLLNYKSQKYSLPIVSALSWRRHRAAASAWEQNREMLILWLLQVCRRSSWGGNIGNAELMISGWTNAQKKKKPTERKKAAFSHDMEVQSAASTSPFWRENVYNNFMQNSWLYNSVHESDVMSLSLCSQKSFFSFWLKDSLALSCWWWRNFLI